MVDPSRATELAQQAASDTEDTVYGIPMKRSSQRAAVMALLRENRSSVHPGRGIENAKVVRRVCQEFNLDEDDFLPNYILKDKKKWGLS